MKVKMTILSEDTTTRLELDRILVSELKKRVQKFWQDTDKGDFNTVWLTKNIGLVGKIKLVREILKKEDEYEVL